MPNRIRVGAGDPGIAWRAAIRGGTARRLGADRDGVRVRGWVAAGAYLGAPYLWGGMSERGINCSGLVHMAFRRLGRLVPRDAHEQEAAAEQVEQVPRLS